MTQIRRFKLAALIFCILIGGQIAVGGTATRGSAQGQEKICPLPEITSAVSVKAWAGKLYISDSRTRDVAVYSLAEGKFLGRIGKAGQGPGEFETGPIIVPLSGGLAAKAFSKLLYFSLEGVFQRESRGFGMDLMVSNLPVFPIEGGYIGFPFVRDEDGRMSDCIGRIYDLNWKPVRDFGARFPSPTPAPPPPAGAPRKEPKSDIDVIRHCADAVFADGKIYLADSRQGFYMGVYDTGGEKIGEIRVPLPLLKVPSEEKKRLVEEWREARKNVLHLYNPVVADTYPAFFAFRLDGDKIRVVTPAKKDGRYEILTLDRKGKILGRAFSFPLELSWRYPPAVNGRFDILDGRLYAVDYNDETEQYELRVTPLR